MRIVFERGWIEVDSRINYIFLIVISNPNGVEIHDPAGFDALAPFDIWRIVENKSTQGHGVPRRKEEKANSIAFLSGLLG
ncbi:MAG: hypothetical protein CME61_08115 [Halobacteriovoraceae bacterium]|nr:hypothetical protein [Halobacteriovoraceae bacterium]